MYINAWTIVIHYVGEAAWRLSQCIADHKNSAIGHFRVLVPLFQTESKCETFHMKMSSARSFFFMQIKFVFMRMVSHLDLLWNKGTRELGNGLLGNIFLQLAAVTTNWVRAILIFWESVSESKFDCLLFELLYIEKLAPQPLFLLVV